VVPATGCTGNRSGRPCAGWAVGLLDPKGGVIDRMEIEVDQNNLQGMPWEWAFQGPGRPVSESLAAMGVFLSGRAEQGLQILENPTKSDSNGRSLFQENRVQINRFRREGYLDQGHISKGQTQAAAIIQGSPITSSEWKETESLSPAAPVFDETSWKTENRSRLSPIACLIDFVQRNGPAGELSVPTGDHEECGIRREAQKNLSSRRRLRR